VSDTPGAAPREFVPHSWCIEFPMGAKHPHRMYITHSENRDRAYAEQRAADMRGQLVPLYTDRRTR
jgi:hypothetical protein